MWMLIEWASLILRGQGSGRQTVGLRTLLIWSLVMFLANVISWGLLEWSWSIIKLLKRLSVFLCYTFPEINVGTYPLYWSKSFHNENWLWMEKGATILHQICRFYIGLLLVYWSDSQLQANTECQQDYHNSLYVL